jgi:hypothetical protein
VQEETMVYQIIVKGELDQRWSGWLGNVNMISKKLDDNSIHTVITVNVPDQPALFGILDRIRDLNIILISVQEVGTKEPNAQ